MKKLLILLSISSFPLIFCSKAQDGSEKEQIAKIEEQNLTSKITNQKHNNQQIKVEISKDGSLEVHRFNTDQIPDSNFGVNGKVIFAEIAPDFKPKSIRQFLVDPQGRILIYGKGEKDNKQYIFSMRLTPDGMPDIQWENMGISLTPQ